MQCGTINFADGEGRGAFCKIVPPQINPLGSRVEGSRNGSDYIGGNYSLGGSVLSEQGVGGGNFSGLHCYSL